jgi:GxxExxY protein
MEKKGYRMSLLHEKLTEQIIGLCIKVHRVLGPGFVEKIYEEALCIELSAAGLPFERQKDVIVRYEGQEIGRHKLDLLIGSVVVLELKAVKCVEDLHLAVARSYLRAANSELALVVNFARPTVEVKRVIQSHKGSR